MSLAERSPEMETSSMMSMGSWHFRKSEEWKSLLAEFGVILDRFA